MEPRVLLSAAGGLELAGAQVQGGQAVSAEMVTTQAAVWSRTVTFDNRLNVVISYLGTVSGLGGTLDAYTVDLNAIAAADQISGVDVVVTGSLYQVGANSCDMSSVVNQDPSLAAIDTHLLLNGAVGATFGGTLAEDNDSQFGGPQGYREGLGTSLGAWGVVPIATQVQNLPFLQVVLPQGGMAYLTGEVATGSGAGFDFSPPGVTGIRIGANAGSAPVLTSGGTISLSAINEDNTSNNGDLVSSLIAGRINSGSQAGIAVVGVDNTHGVWRFSTDGGASWTPFGAVSGTNARLLTDDANTRVQFLPNANFNGTVSNGITFRAWDQTTGVAGGTADASVNGGTTAFSSNTAFAGITVGPINDAPTLTFVSPLNGGVQYRDFPIAYQQLRNASNLADLDSTPVGFLIEGVSAGQLTLNGHSVTAGSSTVMPGDSLVWRNVGAQTGAIAAFTVRGWDGQLASSTAATVTVNVAAATTVQFGNINGNNLTRDVLDGRGVMTRFSLKGPGWGEATWRTTGWDVVMHGTTTATKVTVATRVRGTTTRMEGFTAAGTSSVGSLTAPTVRLVGDVDIRGGAVGTLTLGNVTGPSVITIGRGPAGYASKITLGVVKSLTMTTGTAIRKMSVASLNGADLTAESIGSLSLTGSMVASTIWSAGSIGKVGAAAMKSSNLYAGVAAGVTGLPTAGDMNGSHPSIKSVTLRGVAGSAEQAFVNSNVAAWTIGAFSARDIQRTNAVVPGGVFGLAADTIGSLKIKQGTYGWPRKKLSAEAGIDPALLRAGDFRIRLF